MMIGLSSATLRFLVVIVLVVFAASALGQIRARVDLVVVPVTVRDSDGRLITGLSKEDFVVLEDNKPQTIDSFDTDPRPLSAVIVIDDGMSGTKLKLLYPPFAPPVLVVQTAAFTADDRMAAFRYDSAVHKLADFTNDPVVIEKSLEVIKDLAAGRPTEAADIVGEKGGRFFRSIVNVLSFGHQNEVNPRVEGVLHDAINAAVMALEDQPMDHRKIILVVSDGSVVGPNESSFDRNRTLLLLKQIEVYGVSTAFGTFGSFKALSDYAGATGGDVYPGTSTKSIESAFSRIVEQARYQYVLGYVSNNRAEAATFRTITVKTRNGRYTVIHRRGYTQYPVQ
jgi:Ca-activated chloride channel homolog